MAYDRVQAIRSTKAPEVEHEDENTETLEDEESKLGIKNGKYGVLVQLLEASSADIDDLLHDLPSEEMRDIELELDPRDESLMEKGLSILPRTLQSELEYWRKGAGIANEDALELAEHLEAEEMTNDPEKLAGWIARVTLPDLD